MSNASTERTYTETEAHRYFAQECNQRVWALVAKENRTPEEDAEMVDTAHASLFHWRYAGTGIHQQRGEWLISHTYALLGLGESALRHAERCLALTATYQAEMADFDIAYAYLGMARAHAILGHKTDAQKYLVLAEDAGRAIADEEDREIFTNDLISGNWYGLR
jgi:hypothetical protein